MKEELRVRYSIEANQDQELDAALKACLKQHGWHWYGSGFNHNTGERDLVFDRDEVGCRPANWAGKEIIRGREEVVEASGFVARDWVETEVLGKKEAKEGA